MNHDSDSEIDNESYSYSSYNIDTLDFDRQKIKSKTYKWSGTVSYTILNAGTSTNATPGLSDSLTEQTISSFEDDTIRYYRSVIIDESGNVLCFAPPNSISQSRFTTSFHVNDDVVPDFVHLNEIVEGTMINLFYDPRISSWQIATRGAVGGKYWFFRNNYNDSTNQLDGSADPQKTFKQMFIECFCTDVNELNEIPFLETLPKNYSYSFVLQHPDNHIVLQVHRPALYLVAVYDKRDTTVVNIPQPVYEEWDVFANIDGIIMFPKRFVEKSYKELYAKYCSVQSSYNCVGVMATNLKTGERYAISNPAYEELKKLRGNNPNLQYQYFVLENACQTQTFLHYFPMYKKLFFQFSKQYQDFITNVHQSYFSYYVKKEGIPIAKKFFIHASKIHHNVFIPSLSCGIKTIITRKVVKEYFDEMLPSEKLYYLNYDRRQLAKEKREKQNADGEQDQQDNQDQDSQDNQDNQEIIMDTAAI